MAMADVNNDTQLDIVVANYGSNNIGLLFGCGNGSFASQWIFETGSSSHPSAIVIADVNDDNFLDLVVANYVSNTVPIFLGNGQGAFEPQTPYPTELLSASSFIGHGDFNNNGRSQIVIAYDDSDNVNIVLPYDTRFSSYFTSYTTGSSPWSVAVGDFNNDTRLDIVVANTGINNVSVLLGYGNGSFAAQVTYATGSGPQSVAVGDFNNDTRLDLAVANSGSNTVSVLLGYGNGSFAAQVMYSTGYSPRSVVVGDFNNDNRLDIVVTNYRNNSVSILLGYGNGSFATQVTYTTGSGPQSVAVGDFNNDTRLDIVCGNSDVASVSVFLGYGDGSFTTQVTYSTGLHPVSVAVGDFNNDTRLDIVVANWGSSVSLLLGYGDGSFAAQVTYSTGSNPSSVAVGDFNNDTRLDIVVANNNANSVSVLLGYFVSVFFKQAMLLTSDGSRPRSFVINDFNNDGRMDIAVAKSGSDNIGIFLGYGNITFASQLAFSTSPNSSPYSIAAGDFNKDTYLDIVVTNYKSNNVGVFLGYGNGSFANQTTHPTDHEPQFVAVDDLNNDTIIDIVVANYGSNSLGVFLGYGDGTFSEMTPIPLEYGSRPFSVLIGDFNNDRKLDLAVANNGTDSLYILLQTC
jgi:hypothetical protein